MKNLKYETEILQNFNLVTFEGFEEKNLIAYRWTFEDINDPRNFLPPYILDDNRKKELATGYAISLFETKEAGISRLQELTYNKKQLFKKLGNCIAQGTISEDSGICNTPNSYKHFDLFEFINVDLKLTFSVLEKIA